MSEFENSGRSKSSSSGREVPALPKQKGQTPKRVDGRRNNRPPVEHQIKAGEVRNPYGRGGKKAWAAANSIDQMFLEEGRRIVSHDENGPVDAARRLVQEEFHDALSEHDKAARARLFKQLSTSSDRAEQDGAEFYNWACGRKLDIQDEFYRAKMRGLAPPDIVPHPDHVQLSGRNLRFVGPIDLAGRAVWENIKMMIKVAAALHDIARKAFREDPTEESQLELKQAEAHRRKLMRAVPKSWNWKENIWCRDSKTEFTDDIIRFLRAGDFGEVRDA